MTESNPPADQPNPQEPLNYQQLVEIVGAKKADQMVSLLEQRRQDKFANTGQELTAGLSAFMMTGKDPVTGDTLTIVALLRRQPDGKINPEDTGVFVVIPPEQTDDN